MTSALGDDLTDPAIAIGDRPARAGSAVINAAAVSVAICGGGLLLSAVVDLTDGGRDAASLAAIGAMALVGGLVVERNTPMPERVPPRASLRTVLVGLLSMITVSAITYRTTGTIAHIDDAFVESTSGFTTTALTVIPDPESLGAGMLMWRALTQWIGGYAGMATVIAVLPFLGVSGPAPTRARTPSGPRHLFGGTVQRLLRRYLVLYATLTLIGAGLYLMGGMGVFDATTYALTTISTGGFANHAGSFSHFQSPLLEWMGVAGMFLGGLSLALVWCLLTGRQSLLLRSRELAAYCGLIVGTTAVIAVVETPGTGVAENIRLSAFTATSAVSSTGHWATDWTRWSPGPQMLLLCCIALGAMSGSMGGGFRITRAMALLSYLWRELLVQLQPRLVRSVRVGDEAIPESMMRRILGYQVLYLGMAAAGMFGLALTGADLVTAVSGSVSALATFGPGLGDAGVGNVITGLDHDALLVVSVLMFAGRAEIYPVLDAVVSAAALPRRIARRWSRRGSTVR